MNSNYGKHIGSRCTALFVGTDFFEVEIFWMVDREDKNGVYKIPVWVLGAPCDTNDGMIL